MSLFSKIEWTDATWNPVRGCTKISPGCKHCYAETFAERFRGVKGHPFEQGFDLRLVPQKLGEPLRWSEPRMIFVNSMSDLFHEDVPDDYIDAVAATMQLARLAHLPGADEALRASAGPADRSLERRRGRASYLVGRQRRGPQVRLAANRATCEQRLPRCASFRSSRCWRISADCRLTGICVGDRRRRERPRCAADGRGVGPLHPRSMPRQRASRSSSSSGAECARKPQAGHYEAERTMRSQRGVENPTLPALLRLQHALAVENGELVQLGR